MGRKVIIGFTHFSVWEIESITLWHDIVVFLLGAILILASLDWNLIFTGQTSLFDIAMGGKYDKTHPGHFIVAGKSTGLHGDENIKRIFVQDGG